ncbi:MAG TPA: DUF2784 family protein [Candidatus Paceibacterota bacterium]|nr:DUF2784 family protein [Candidatus Paceibacterota bacterium]
MSRTAYAKLAKATTAFHFFWTALLFAGGVLVFFYPRYAWYQIAIMTFTILIWFPFGLKCPLTIWTRYFEKRAGIDHGDTRTFMVKQLSALLGRDLHRFRVSVAVALFYIEAYLLAIGTLVGWRR